MHTPHIHTVPFDQQHTLHNHAYVDSKHVEHVGVGQSCDVYAYKCGYACYVDPDEIQLPMLFMLAVGAVGGFDQMSITLITKHAQTKRTW